jgi:hypothetical protein
LTWPSHTQVLIRADDRLPLARTSSPGRALLNLDFEGGHMLAEEQIEQFRTFGFLVLPGALDGVTLGG